MHMETKKIEREDDGDQKQERIRAIRRAVDNKKCERE